MGQCPFLFAVDCEFEIQILESLLKEGCDLNSKDSQGDSALHYASYLDNKITEDWLISKGIPKTIRNDAGLSPYD